MMAPQGTEVPMPDTGNTGIEKSPYAVRHTVWIVAALLLVYAGAATGILRVEYPIDDEAYFASPAFNLAHKGFFGTTVVESVGTNWKGRSQATYWIQPLHGLLLAGWARVFGATLWSQRSLSAVFGALDLCAWFLIVRTLAGRDSPALVTMALLAVDHKLLGVAGSGRMDMMAAALGHSALAAYLVLRERSLSRALLAGYSLVVLSGLTHPIGGVLSLVNLSLAIVYMDRSVLRWKHAALIAVPFLVGGLAWGAYIARHPDWFLAQFMGNAGDIDIHGTARLSGFRNPLAALYRFGHNMVQYETADFSRCPPGGPACAPAGDFTWRSLVKLYVLALYAFSLIAALSIKALRRSSGVMLVVLLFAADYSALAVMEARPLIVKYYAHVLVVMPALIALLREYWRRTLFTAACVLLAAVQCSKLASSIWHNGYRSDYAPTARLLQQPPYRGADMWAKAEYAYAAGFDRVVEDLNYGRYSHRCPPFIVIPADDFEGALNASDYNKRLLTVEYAVRYRDSRIVILGRTVVLGRTAAAGAGPRVPSDRLQVPTARFRGSHK
jgi:hypothetical protein